MLCAVSYHNGFRHIIRRAQTIGPRRIILIIHNGIPLCVTFCIRNLEAVVFNICFDSAVGGDHWKKYVVPQNLQYIIIEEVQKCSVNSFVSNAARNSYSDQIPILKFHNIKIWLLFNNKLVIGLRYAEIQRAVGHIFFTGAFVHNFKGGRRYFKFFVCLGKHGVGQNYAVLVGLF